MSVKKTDDEEPVEAEEVDPSKNKAVTGRPNDLKIEERKPALPNSTFGSRSKEAVKRNKRVADEDVERK